MYIAYALACFSYIQICIYKCYIIFKSKWTFYRKIVYRFFSYQLWRDLYIKSIIYWFYFFFLCIKLGLIMIDNIQSIWQYCTRYIYIIYSLCFVAFNLYILNAIWRYGNGKQNSWNEFHVYHVYYVCI